MITPRSMPYPTIILPAAVTVERVFVKNSLPSAGFKAYSFEEAKKLGVIKVVSFDGAACLELAFCRSSVQVVTTTATTTAT
jgi:hypothetical protein